MFLLKYNNELMVYNILFYFLIQQLLEKPNFMMLNIMANDYQHLFYFNFEVINIIQ